MIHLTMEVSIFSKIFGNAPKVRIWDYLLDNISLDFTKSDIARQTEISRATLDRLWPYLIENKILMENRRIGAAVLFKVNGENKLIKRMLELDNFLIEKEFDKVTKEITLNI